MTDRPHPDADPVAANRRLWDRWTEVHADSDFYDVEAFLAGACTLQEIELAEVGDVGGRDLLHLQCHFGLDTLSWSRRGARATGVDFSPRAIERARRLAAETGLDARFLCRDVYDLPAELAGAFDVVFASYGVLWWLPDLPRWAAAAARCLRPGGFLYLAEFHPLTCCLDDDGALAWDLYFRGSGPVVDEAPPSYADPDARPARGERAAGWPYPLGEVVSALLAAGLRLDAMTELDWSPVGCFPFLEESSPGRWTVRGTDARLPLVVTLRATLHDPG